LRIAVIVSMRNFVADAAYFFVLVGYDHLLLTRPGMLR